MIDRAQLLADLQTLVRKLEADLQERVKAPEVPEVGETLRSQYDEAKAADRTAQTFNQWVTDQQTQVAVAWVLSATFARFLEDNGLVSPPRLAGPGEALLRARDEHEAYFREHPTQTDREYLLWVFGELAKLPGAKEIFGEGNLIWDIPNWLSGDAAGAILAFFQTIDPGTGELVHDFTDEAWDTRFLGDLYQDLSATARKKYALLQTPSFVEAFILDRTLEPAVEEFGLAEVRMIDPACGSGHFLLGAFQRLLTRWQKQEPGTYVEELARRALNAVHGVDVNPFAVAIARFRLLLAAMQATGQRRLQEARAFPLNLACGDSLLHGEGSQLVLGEWAPMAHHFVSEDIAALNRILRRGHYHAVVANPPYIVPKDKALKVAYNRRYKSCHRQYSLAAPFMERIFQLAAKGGYTGQITANSFMKREFGKKLIEEFLPEKELTYIIDTSLAYIPGHGIPTVILFARNRSPIATSIRTVMGIQREDSQPENPANGLYWKAILEQVDVPNSESALLSVEDSDRADFNQHPWTLSGGGAVKLLSYINAVKDSKSLNDYVFAIGRIGHTGNDEAYITDSYSLLRRKIPQKYISQLVEGEDLRHWKISKNKSILFPYNRKLEVIDESHESSVFRWLWILRDQLWDRREPNGTHREIGKSWLEISRFHPERYLGDFIAFPSVSTHNHFVLDEGQKFCKQSAPAIKVKPEFPRTTRFKLLSYLNSSVACFWLRQVCHDKGGGGIGGGVAAETWERFFDFDGTKIKGFPIPESLSTETSERLHELAQRIGDFLPSSLLIGRFSSINSNYLEELRNKVNRLQDLMISLQEELDWECYNLYKIWNEALTYDKAPPPIQLGQRAFEIVMARKMAAGELETTWFERHRSTPITTLPDHWPDEYKQLVERRIQLIETDKNIRLIEQPEYKRRWNTEPWESQLERALQIWLLNRLESYFDLDGRMNDAGEVTAQVTAPALTSTAKVADIARQDPDFQQVGELYTHDAAFDVLKLVNALVETESVPLLPVLRYKPSGLRKRQDWEHTWALQRQEDAIDTRTQLPKDHPDYLDSTAATHHKAEQVGDIPVPPKYTTSDFLKTHYWKLRGKLDVPKERWVSFPHCEGPDGQPVIAWAGYDHLQLAQAISAYYVDVQERFGGRDDPRLIPLLGCLLELLPWLQQWHNDLDPDYGLKMGDYYAGFIDDEARQLNLTIDDIQSWEPPKKKGRRKRK